ncbi:MAG: glutamyl-tRNA reductase [Vicinamibacterales bacterium]
MAAASLFAVGLSHRTAPVELRECVDFSRLGAADALAALASRGIAGEAVILSTCNRAEIYAVAGPDAPDAVGRFFADYHQVPLPRLTEHLIVRRGAEAARHLFRVAAGLDSLVVGEPQILGQVKSAYASASDAGCTAAITNRLFHSAFGVGKRVRHETGLAEGAVSVSYAAISLARKIFGDLTGLHVVILGAGGMAKLTGLHLKAQDVRQITIASRTLQSAAMLAEQLGGQAVPWQDVPAALGDADIVITATGATEPVLTRRGVQDVMRPRRQRPLFLIDIALPRDVEPGVGDLEQVFLYNIDDLQGIVKENLTRRSEELERAETIVAEEVEKFAAWLHSRDVIPTVIALRERFEAIRKSELARLGPKLAGLPPDAHDRLDEVTRLIVEKLLLAPTEQLKSVRDETTIAQYADAVNRLFRLEDEQAPRPRAKVTSLKRD